MRSPFLPKPSTAKRDIFNPEASTLPPHRYGLQCTRAAVVPVTSYLRFQIWKFSRVLDSLMGTSGLVIPISVVLQLDRSLVSVTARVMYANSLKCGVSSLDGSGFQVQALSPEPYTLNPNLEALAISSKMQIRISQNPYSNVAEAQNWGLTQFESYSSGFPNIICLWYPPPTQLGLELIRATMYMP